MPPIQFTGAREKTCHNSVRKPTSKVGRHPKNTLRASSFTGEKEASFHLFHALKDFSPSRPHRPSSLRPCGACIIEIAFTFLSPRLVALPPCVSPPPLLKSHLAVGCFVGNPKKGCATHPIVSCTIWASSDWSSSAPRSSSATSTPTPVFACPRCLRPPPLRAEGNPTTMLLVDELVQAASPEIDPALQALLHLFILF